jgi:hypothetical protein
MKVLLTGNTLLTQMDDDDNVDVVRLRLWTVATIIPQMIYEHGETYWNDIDREHSYFVHQSSLEILPAVI